MSLAMKRIEDEKTSQKRAQTKGQKKGQGQGQGLGQERRVVRVDVMGGR